MLPPPPPASMEAAVCPDWAALPEDLMAMVMRLLDIRDMFHAGAVCTTWYAAYSLVRSVRIPIKDTSPCLLYSCAGDDADTATLYSPSAGATFKVRLPGPAFRSRYVFGSDHGWIVAADEESNLQALNPLTGDQVDLPPVTGLYLVENCCDDQGHPAYNLRDDLMAPGSKDIYSRRQLRLYLYNRVYLSCSPSAGAECIVLLVHRHGGEMSFARVGDNLWTQISWKESDPGSVWDSGCRGAKYNNKDGLFYVLFADDSIFALDLNGPSPVATKIIQGAARWENSVKSIVLTPWDDMLQVRRYMELRSLATPVQVPPEHAQDILDPCSERYTVEIELYKIHIQDQKLVKLNSSDLQEHAIFLGFNSTLLISTKDFPTLKPNCGYLTDNNWEEICINMYGLRDIGIWNFVTETLESFGDVQSSHPWLNWPPPIWITPSLS